MLTKFEKLDIAIINDEEFIITTQPKILHID